MLKPREKEKPLKLTNAQMADLTIAILRGLGVRNAEEIGGKVDYSGAGVKNREKGPNQMLMVEIAQIIKHERSTQRRLIEEVNAQNLREKIGERSGKLLAGIDDGLEDGDTQFRAKFSKGIVKDLVLAPLRGAGRPRKGGETGEAGALVYNVSIKSMKVVHAHVKHEPITVPDRQKAIDAIPTKVELPAKDAENVRR